MWVTKLWLCLEKRLLRGYFTHVFKVAKDEYKFKFEVFKVIKQEESNKNLRIRQWTKIYRTDPFSLFFFIFFLCSLFCLSIPFSFLFLPFFQVRFPKAWRDESLAWGSWQSLWCTELECYSPSLSLPVFRLHPPLRVCTASTAASAHSLSAARHY